MKRRSALKSISLGMGYTISAAGMATFITGCKQDGTISEVGAWAPSFLTKEQCSLVENILDAMLPTTAASPGYKAVGAIQIADNTLNKLYKAKDQDLFKKGMGILMSRFKSESDLASFMEKYMGKKTDDEKKQVAEVLALDRENLPADKSDDYHLYKAIESLRSLGISSYFASETIAMEHLSYDPVPGQWNGCIPVSEVGNVWSL